MFKIKRKGTVIKANLVHATGIQCGCTRAPLVKGTNRNKAETKLPTTFKRGGFCATKAIKNRNIQKKHKNKNKTKEVWMTRVFTFLGAKGAPISNINFL